MRTTPLATLALATLVLTACGSQTAGDNTAAAPAMNEIENATGTVDEADAGPADLAAQLPGYVPLIPGGEVQFAEERGGIFSAAIQAPGTVKEAAAWYETALKDAGMNPAKQTGVGDGVQLTSREKGRDLKITVGPAPNGDATVGVTDRPGG